MDHTTNYQLSQWSRTDRVLMDDFNADNAKLDAALKAEADARTALAAELAKRGNCRIEVTSYVGTGTSDNRIVFRKMPVFFIVIGGPACVMGFGGTTSPRYFGSGPTDANGGSSPYIGGFSASWSGNQMITASETMVKLINQRDKLYQIIAFYAMDEE